MAIYGGSHLQRESYSSKGVTFSDRLPLAKVTFFGSIAAVRGGQPLRRESNPAKGLIVSD
jgi:hypothetical protein